MMKNYRFLFQFSIPDLIQSIYLFSFLIALIYAFLYLVFSEITWVKVATTVLIFLTWIIINGSFRGIFKLSNWWSSDLGDFEKSRKKLFIGWCAAFIFGWLPRIFVYSVTLFYPYEDAIITYLIYISLPAILFSWSLFVLQTKTTGWKVVYEKSDRVPWIILLINMFLLLITVRLGMLFNWYEDRNRIIYTQIGFVGICSASMIELAQIWRGKLEKVEFEEKEEENPSLLESGEKSSDSRLECKICMQEYSKTSIPRILKECGHTVCEKCADNLLDKKQHLFCPFCQKVTLVNGTASLLPKNFTIMDLIDEKIDNNA